MLSHDAQTCEWGRVREVNGRGTDGAFHSCWLTWPHLVVKSDSAANIQRSSALPSLYNASASNPLSPIPNWDFWIGFRISFPNISILSPCVHLLTSYPTKAEAVVSQHFCFAVTIFLFWNRTWQLSGVDLTVKLRDTAQSLAKRLLTGKLLAIQHNINNPPFWLWGFRK